jgi:nitrite reductase (NADH) small subunit
MAEFQRVMSVSDLPPTGEAREVPCGGRLICIARAGDAITAMDNVCPHRGGPLGQGIVEEGKLICPWHAWAFDVKTGVAVHTPDVKVDVYEVEVVGQDVLVKL